MYRCWRYKSEPKFRGGMTPTEAFRTLARSIGKRYRETAEATTDPREATARQSAFERAAGYFRFALDINRHDDVDPLAFTELVRLEVSRDNFGAIEGIARTYEQSLFESKGMAYAQNQVETIYQFHKSLGELYAMLGVWGDSANAKSAIFQLEHARKVSGDLERKYAGTHPGGGAPLPEEYRFSPEMTDLLARSYEGVGEAAKVLPLRLEQAERYEQAGDRAAARKVLAPVRAVTPPQELQPRFDRVLRAVDTAAEPQAPAVVAPPAGAIERAPRFREMRP
jgi:hypothetical protein